jgi:5,10-methylenetetrahydromethanopterin reductase
MHTAWVRNGRNLAEFYAAASTGGCVLDEGESADSKRCMAQAAPFAAIVFHNLVEKDQFGSIVPLEGPFPFEAELEAYRKVYLEYAPADARYLSNHRGHLMFGRPEEQHLSANVVRGLTFTGTRSELVERAQGMAAIGYKQIAINIVPGQEDDMLQRLAEVMERF